MKQDNDRDRQYSRHALLRLLDNENRLEAVYADRGGVLKVFVSKSTEEKTGRTHTLGTGWEKDIHYLRGICDGFMKNFNITKRPNNNDYSSGLTMAELYKPKSCITDPFTGIIETFANEIDDIEKNLSIINAGEKEYARLREKQYTCIMPRRDAMAVALAV